MTANQLTLLRIALLPIPCALLLFGNPTWNWVAFFLFVFLGMTDFVDGMMARKEGPTKLGSLLDPAADKIMMAAITLSLSANAWVPFWIPIVILSREFLVTVLRSSVALRGEQVKTSTLAKLKTIIQMGGFGTVFMTVFLSSQHAMWAALFLFVCFVLIWGCCLLSRKKKAPYWALPVASCFLYWFLLLELLPSQWVVLALSSVIIAVTWWSALDYLKVSYRLFFRTGLNKQDVARFFWALAFGILMVSVASLDPSWLLSVLVCIAFELALGGIDNIATAEQNPLHNQFFVLTGSLACIFWIWPNYGLAIILIVVSLLACFLAIKRAKLL